MLSMLLLLLLSLLLHHCCCCFVVVVVMLQVTSCYLLTDFTDNFNISFGIYSLFSFLNELQFHNYNAKNVFSKYSNSKTQLNLSIEQMSNNTHIWMHAHTHTHSHTYERTHTHKKMSINYESSRKLSVITVRLDKSLLCQSIWHSFDGGFNDLQSSLKVCLSFSTIVRVVVWLL